MRTESSFEHIDRRAMLAKLAAGAVVGTVTSFTVAGRSEAKDNEDGALAVEILQGNFEIFRTCVLNGDLLCAAQRYDENAVFLFPDVPFIEGREGILQLFQTVAAQGLVDIEATYFYGRFIKKSTILGNADITLTFQLPTGGQVQSSARNSLVIRETAKHDWLAISETILMD